VLAVLSEEVQRIEFAEARGIEVAAKRLAVVELNNHLFVGAGWGAKFQRTELPLQGRNLHGMKLYVMLSAKFLSTYCF